MSRSPLDHPRLAIIEKKLDAGELDEAQHLLAQLGDNYFFRHATTYLASRLLFLRGTLDEESLAERLTRLIEDTPEFPEAEALLARLRSGALVPGAGSGRSSRPPPDSPGSRPASRSSRPPEPELAVAFGASAVGDHGLVAPRIPRAGRVPAVAMPVPVARSDSIPDLEVPGGTGAPPGFGPPPSAPPETPHVGHEPELTERSHPARAAARVPGERASAADGSAAVAHERRVVTPGPTASGRAPARAAARRDDDGPPVERGSLFEVTALLDAGRPEEALALLAQRDAADEPDHALLEARALARAGRTREAVELARRLAAAPLLEPTLRAGVARLALELDEVELGLEQATRAHEDDPTQPTIRLTYAWAALRRARRVADRDLVSRATLALRELVGDGGPHEGLVLGLRACVEAHAGDAQRALRLAERAVALEPTADGWAALAMAAARLGRADDVKRASAALREASPAEAAALREALEKHGEALFGLRAPAESVHAPPASAGVEASVLWGPLELAVVDGHWRQAFSTFGQLAKDTLAQVTPATLHEPPALAAVAASFLTVAPISRDLAPYDQTPWGLQRLGDLVALLARGATDVDVTHPLVTLLGAYVGETLRLCHRARWQGSVDDPASRVVIGERGSYFPHRLVADGLAGRDDLAVVADAAAAEANPASVASHLPAVTPLCPWDPAPWPAPSRLPGYAAALERSVISIWCMQRTGTRLDRSLASLRAVDEYVERIAPDRAPSPGDTRWARRATVLLGAYLGEVLRRATGGNWSKRDALELGPASYRLVLPTGQELWPVEHVFTRLTASAIPLHEYARRAVR